MHHYINVHNILNPEIKYNENHHSVVSSAQDKLKTNFNSEVLIEQMISPWFILAEIFCYSRREKKQPLSTQTRIICSKQ